MATKPRTDPRTIEGWMTEAELNWLSAHASKHSGVVEIGSWKGRSTCALLSACDGMVTAVDHFKGSTGELGSTHAEAVTQDIYTQFMKNVGEFPNLSVLRMSSNEAADIFENRSVDMVFIDGDHEERAVYRDLIAWIPKCKRLLCGHDSNWPGVQNALRRLNIPWSSGAGSIWFVEIDYEGKFVKPTERVVPKAARKGIALAIVTGRGSCPVEMVSNLVMQSWPTNTNLTTLNVYGVDTDQGRNTAVKAAREAGHRYIWFIDDDTVPPPDAGRKLLYLLEQNGPPNGKVMVAGGIYTTRSSPPEPLVFMGQGEGPYWQWRAGEIFKCWGLGTGCMMVNMDLFDELPEPWFKTISEHDRRWSDDLYFCDEVAKAGYEVMAHGGVLCHHYDMERGIIYELPRGSNTYQNPNGDVSEPSIIRS